MNLLHKIILIAIVSLLSANFALAAKPLYELSATEAAGMIKNGEITSMQLVTTLFERIEANADLNTFITLDKEGALKAAAQADLAVTQGGPLGKLHGVPVAIKDNMDVAGLPTTAGTPGMLNVVPDKDADIVAVLKAEGAIIVGKTNLHELGFGITCDNAYFGAVRNPYNKDYMVGGSSGGNAAALAANLIPLAIGSDTGGSIRIPASLCGVYGFRPSVGRYPMQGFIPMAPTKDVVGPMARTVYDLVLVDSIVNGYNPAEIKALNLQGLRIGVPRYPLWQNVDAATAEVMDQALQKLEAAGVVLVNADLDLPDIYNLNRYIDYYIVLHECRRDFPKYLAAYGLTVTKVAGQIADRDIKHYFTELLLDARVKTQPYYDEVMNNYRQQMLDSWQRYFAENRVDFIISPTTILPARPLADSKKHVEINGETLSTSSAYLQNTGLTSNVGFAGISIPVGVTSNGLPVGLELDTLSGNDINLLRLALALEIIMSTNLSKNN